MKNFRFALILAIACCAVFAAEISLNFQSLVQKNGNTLHGFLKYMLTNFSTQQIGLIYASKQRCDAINQDRNINWICILNLRIALLDNDAKQMLCGAKVPNSGRRKRQALQDEPEKQLLNIHDNNNANETHRRTRRDVPEIPTSFDIRERWPACAFRFNEIYDQGMCGACWAVASAMVIQDRLCIQQIQMGKTPQKSYGWQLSSWYLMLCSGAADDGVNGCNGGWPHIAMDYVAKNRIVTGSNYYNQSFCMPYMFDPIETLNLTTPTCSNACTNRRYARWPGWSFRNDKNVLGNGSGLEAKSMAGSDTVDITQLIQQEIMANGSVCATMTVFFEFYYYTRGIFAPTSTNPLYIAGYHAVRVTGWGRGANADGIIKNYWLVANSWNTTWGENGFVKIEMGTCDIETSSIDYLWIKGRSTGL